MMESIPPVSPPPTKCGVLLPVLVFLASGLVVFRMVREPDSPPPPPRHSVAFNHRVHLNEEMECTDCHAGAISAAVAGIPAVSVCKECHTNPKGKSQEEAHLRELLAKGEPVSFRPATELTEAGVFFSHRRHTKVGKIKCETCHGDMKQYVRPPETSTVSLNMDTCLKCHAKQAASQDCLSCHR